jgi:hypothetical protein
VEAKEVDLTEAEGKIVVTTGGKRLEIGWMTGTKVQLDRKSKFQCSIPYCSNYSLQQFIIYFKITSKE